MGWLYYLMQAATMLILVLAANTAFADFPRLTWFLARDQLHAASVQFPRGAAGVRPGLMTLG